MPVYHFQAKRSLSPREATASSSAIVVEEHDRGGGVKFRRRANLHDGGGGSGLEVCHRRDATGSVAVVHCVDCGGVCSTRRRPRWDMGDCEEKWSTG